MSDIIELEDKILLFIEASLTMEEEEFDLHNADLESCVRYRLLRRLYVKHATELITLVETSADQLREQLANMLRDC